DGAGVLEERVGAIRLRLSPRAFFQPNRDVAALIYAEVAHRAEPLAGRRALDLYSGVGGIAMTIAHQGGEVLGVEEVSGAVADAVAGAAINNLTNVRFISGDTASVLADPALGADVIVLDPPRAGCAPAVLAACGRIAPEKLLYVS